MPEAYIAFEEVREEFGLPRNRFTLLMNDWGIQNPGLKANYYKSQREWIIREIARRLNASPNSIQLNVGIQFGLGSRGQSNVVLTKKLLQSEQGRKQLIAHLNLFGGEIYITELVADNYDEIIKVLRLLKEVNGIRMINFWDGLNRDFPGQTIVDKNTYEPLPSYFSLIDTLLLLNNE